MNFSIFTSAGNAPDSVLYSKDLSLTAKPSTDLIATLAWQGIDGLDWHLDAGTYWIAFTSNDINMVTRSGVESPLSDNKMMISRSSGWRDSSQNFGVRIWGEPDPVVAAPVPEPATWAIMIVGFGMIGASMRNRARVRTSINFA